VDAIPGILALLTGIAGWFYLFCSKAAEEMSGIEDDRINRRRISLRRAGGGVMLLLAIGFYVGSYAADPQRRPKLFLAVWSGVITLLAALVILAFIDVRLTLKLRKRRSPR
jgi:hypothetical protein